MVFEIEITFQLLVNCMEFKIKVSNIYITAVIFQKM